ncbi:hypothetical protein M9H77_04244 [Catharanthus roseus]|uniref:Uncharacterized protein n=1 Tax=Catharanthus roseus TaxID=4058 RepID=A0ACC0CDJ7_CATRO|nr:hypothetical protein M9H77_04244 [Catharanthus roseus]
MPSQGVAKVETLKLSMIEEFSKVNELSQATVEVEESLVLHVNEEISNVEHCHLMGEEMIEKREETIERKCIEKKEEEGVEEKESLSEHLECSKEKESELEKSERVKENECLIEKQENEKEEQREKEIVVFEKNEELDFYANETNSFFASEFLCVQDFEDSSKDEGGKLAYKSIKAINFFFSNSYLSFEIYFKEIKLFSLAFMENGYQFHFFNSLGTLLERKNL